MTTGYCCIDMFSAHGFAVDAVAVEVIAVVNIVIIVMFRLSIWDNGGCRPRAVRRRQDPGASRRILA